MTKEWRMIYLWFNIEYGDLPTPMDIPDGLEFRTVPGKR